MKRTTGGYYLYFIEKRFIKKLFLVYFFSWHKKCFNHSEKVFFSCVIRNNCTQDTDELCDQIAFFIFCYSINTIKKLFKHLVFLVEGVYLGLFTKKQKHYYKYADILASNNKLYIKKSIIYIVHQCLLLVVLPTPHVQPKSPHFHLN